MSTPAMLQQSQGVAFTFSCAAAPPETLRVRA